MKFEKILNGKYTPLIMGLSAFLIGGIGLMFAIGGIDSNRLLSQFSGTYVTPATAASMWSSSPNNPYLGSIGVYQTRIDAVIRGTLSKGEKLPTLNFQKYLDNLTAGIVLMGNEPEYASNQDIKNIIGYIAFELTDAKNTFSTSNVFISAYTDMVNGVLVSSGSGVISSGSGVIASGTGTTMVSSTGTTTPVESINLPIMGLAYGGAGSPWGYEGYEPIKVGKTIIIGYETVGMRQCKGWYSKSGESLGQEVQFNWSDNNGNSGGGNSTSLAKGEFKLRIDYPTRLEFTCWGAVSGKATKQVIEFRTKAHDTTDTFIDVSKETITAAGDTLNISWQANPDFGYCHLSKTHSVNGVKGNSTVFLAKTLKISDKASGTITDTIATAGRYVYILFCNDSPESTVDLFDSGLMITSKAVFLADSSTTSAATHKNANGVLYSDIRAFVTGVIDETNISEQARALKLFNQMGVSKVSAADIVYAFKDTTTQLTLSDVNSYLDKRNVPATPTQTTTATQTTSTSTPPVVSEKNANGVSYTSIKDAILSILNDTSLSDSVRAQRIYDAMESNGVSVADVVFAFKDTSTPLTADVINAFLAKRNIATTLPAQDSKIVLASTMTNPSGRVAGSTNHDIAAYSIKAEGTRDVSLSSIKVRLSGTAAASTSNYRFRYNNTDYTIGSVVGNEVTFTLSPAFIISAGQTVSFMVRADTSNIIPSSNGTVTLGTSLDGVSGTNNASNAVSYSYNDVNAINSGTIYISDSYPVTGAVISF